MLQRIHHAAIICSDYAVSRHFYVELLGLKVVAENPQPERQAVKLDLALPDGGQIELFAFPQAPLRLSYPEARGLRHLAFAVDDVAAAKAELEARGVTVGPVRHDTYTHRRFAFLSDPDGLPLELYEAPMPRMAEDDAPAGASSSRAVPDDGRDNDRDQRRSIGHSTQRDT